MSDMDFGIGAAVGAIGNIIGNAQQFRNQMKLQHDSQQFQASESQKSRDYQTEMWEKSNEYNNASSQVQRLRDAGLNPYMMMSGGNAGTAQSLGAPSQASASQGSAASLNFDAVGQQITNAFMQKRQLDQEKPKVDSEVEKNNAEADAAKANANVANTNADIASQEFGMRKPYYSEMLDAGLLETYSNIDLNNANASGARLLNPQQFDLLQQQKDWYGEQSATLRAQAVLTNLKSDEQQIINKYLPDNLQAEIFTLVAQGQQAQATAILNGVLANLHGMEYNKLLDTYESTCRALNAQNEYWSDYYGSPSWTNFNDFSRWQASKGNQKFNLDFDIGSANYDLTRANTYTTLNPLIDTAGGIERYISGPNYTRAFDEAFSPRQNNLNPNVGTITRTPYLPPRAYDRNGRLYFKPITGYPPLAAPASAFKGFQYPGFLGKVQAWSNYNFRNPVGFKTPR